MSIAKVERNQAILKAREWLKMKPYIVEITPTQLNEHAAVCDVAVISWQGDEIVDSFIKPLTPLRADVIQEYAVSPTYMLTAPEFRDIWQSQLAVIFSGKVLGAEQPLIMWDAAFVEGCIRKTLAGYNIAPKFMKPPLCAMLLYTEYADLFTPGGFARSVIREAALDFTISYQFIHQRRAINRAHKVLEVLRYMSRLTVLP